jgi:hypothetical protein
MFGGWGFAIALAAKRKRAKELLTEVIGIPFKDAVDRIKEAGLLVQVMSINGTQCTTDGQFNPDRIGIVVSGGLVKGAQIG